MGTTPSRALVSFLVVLLAARASAGVVDGVVVDALKQKPVRGAQVTLTSSDDGARHVTTTDPDGRFRLAALPAARYRVSASKRGYLDFRGKPGEPGPAVVEVRDGGDTGDLQIPLRLPGAISGEVTDEQGAGFVGAQVKARRVSEIEGAARFTWTAKAVVDDEGRFRVFGLPPGRYVLEAAPPPTPRQGEIIVQPALDDPGGDRLDDAYLPVFYANAPDPSQAAPIELGPGEQRIGVHIRLRPRRALRLSGRIANTRSAPRIDLIRIGFESAAEYVDPDRLSPDAEFVFRGLTPGAYVLVAQEGRGATWRGAVEKITLTDSPVEEFDVRLRPATPVTGLLQEVTASREERPDSVWVSLAPVDMPGDLRLSARMDRRQRFVIDRALAGRYVVEAHGYSSKSASLYYLREVRLDGRRAEGHTITVEAGAEAHFLTIALGKAPTLSGTVPGAPDLSVVVAWLETREGPAKLVSIDPEGRFLFDGLEPSEGRVLAISGFSPDEHGGPEFWRKAWTRGAKVQLEDAGEAQAIVGTVPAESLR